MKLLLISILSLTLSSSGSADTQSQSSSNLTIAKCLKSDNSGCVNVDWFLVKPSISQEIYVKVNAGNCILSEQSRVRIWTDHGENENLPAFVYGEIGSEILVHLSLGGEVIVVDSADDVIDPTTKKANSYGNQTCRLNYTLEDSQHRPVYNTSDLEPRFGVRDSI
jgi:hypothetical protein